MLTATEAREQRLSSSATAEALAWMRDTCPASSVRRSVKSSYSRAETRSEAVRMSLSRFFSSWVM